MSLVIKNALWLSHVLVYWIKENPNIIVINTNNITIHGGSRVLIHNYSCVCCDVTILQWQWQWLWGLERHISTAIHLRITWLWLSESITLFTSIVTSGKWYRFPFFWQPHTHTPAWLTAHCLDLQWTGQHPTAPKHCMTFSNCARCGLQSTRQQMPSNITTSCCG